MGRAVLPSISKLEDVLDLITNPEKYKQYIAEFTSIYNETVVKLGDLQTKDMADTYLGHADEARSAAIKDREEAKKTLNHANFEADKVANEARTLREQLEADASEQIKTFDVQIVALRQRVKEFDQYEQSTKDMLAAKEFALNTKRLALEKLAAELSAKEDKFKAALA